MPNMLFFWELFAVSKEVSLWCQHRALFWQAAIRRRRCLVSPSQHPFLYAPPAPPAPLLIEMLLLSADADADADVCLFVCSLVSASLPLSPVCQMLVAFVSCHVLSGDLHGFDVGMAIAITVTVSQAYVSVRCPLSVVRLFHVGSLGGWSNACKR